MPAGALHLLFLLLLQMRCVTLLIIPQDGAAAEAQKDLAQRLDALFDLRDVSPAAPAVPRHRKAPQFMLDLFNAVSVSDGTQKSQKEILEGNIVRSFEDKGHNRGRIHFFNLSTLGKEEKIVKAEFRWFRRKLKFFLGKSRGPHFYQVNLYEVLENEVKPRRGNLITSRLVPLYTQGWEVFDVTQMINKWIQNSQENNGILVVPTLLNWMELEIPSSNQTGEMMNTNAYLVIYSDDGRNEVNQSRLGPTQPAAASPEPQHHLSRRRRRAPSDIPLRGRPQSCQRVPLFVDFKEIGWSSWIISPRGYNAYNCKGSCPFPLGVGLRATNHATVRSIMHALKLSVDEVRAPCCVPDRLQSISLLYFDDEENVVLKQFDDMVALSCGCH